MSRFTNGITFDDYLDDEMLRAAVERQFEIIGEALNQLSKRDPDRANKIPDLARIVAFRNILIHGSACRGSSARPRTGAHASDRECCAPPDRAAC
ncbi:MAG: HepT-like ribonuclease domain-containing protein [Geminicoccales bacterium]